MLDKENKHDLNLWQKLAAISKEIGHIEKTGKNQHFNYAFMEHAQLVASLRPIMDEYGVTVDFEAMDATFVDTGKSFRVTLHMKYYVTNADKPSEHFERLWVSEAMDQQDKGINKALTAAEKNVFAKLFHVSDRDLEDDANDTQPPARKTQPQATRPVAAPNQPQQSNRTAPGPAPSQAAPQSPRPVTPAPTSSSPSPAPSDEPATEQQRQAIVKMGGRMGMEEIELNRRIKELYAVELKTLSRNDAAHFIKVLQGQV